MCELSLGMYLRTIMSIVSIDDPQGRECSTGLHMGNDVPVSTKNVYVHWPTHIGGTKAYSVHLSRRFDSLCHAFWYGGELHVRHRKRNDLPLAVEGIS